MKRQDFEKVLIEFGWKKDNYGNYKKISNVYDPDGNKMEKEYRMKLQKNSVRYETCYHTTATAYSKSEKKWLRISSAYYRDISISENGKLTGFKR